MKVDVELLRQYAREGREAAFAEVVRRQVDWVYSVALRVGGGDRGLAEDVAQRVFVELARRAGALAERESIAGWLHTTARYMALAAIRDERRRRAREQEAWIVNGPEESAPEWERVRPLLDEAVGKLRDGEREAVTLRFFQGKSHREVGAILGLGEEAARKRVDQRLALADILSETRKTLPPGNGRNGNQLVQAWQTAETAHAAEIFTPEQAALLPEIQAQEREDVGIEEPAQDGAVGGGQ